MDTEQYNAEYDQGYDQAYGTDQPPMRTPRTTAELDGGPPLKQQRPRRAPLTMTALVVIGVVAIVLGPSLIWAYSLTVRPDEAAATMPQQSEAVTISVTSGMLAMVAGFALGQKRGRSEREDEEF